MPSVLLIFLSTLLARTLAGTKHVVIPKEFHCISELPSCLSYHEPLLPPVQPANITIMFGSNGPMELRGHESILMAFHSIKDLAAHHGYNIIRMDELKMDLSSKLDAGRYHPKWKKLHTMSALRSAHPHSKYFIFIDENLLAPHPETDVFNHYINMMEAEPEWKMLTTQPPSHNVINTSLMVFKNDDFCFNAFSQSIEYAQNVLKELVKNGPHEKGALAQYLRSVDIDGVHHRTVPAQGPPYSLNTIYWLNFCEASGPLDRYEYGDAIIQFPGDLDGFKMRAMRGVKQEAEAWKKARPSFCNYPITFQH